MPMVKALFFIPLKDEDGRDLRPDMDDLELELYARFVGWTLFGIVRGAYRMANGERAIDDCAAYIVIFEESRIVELEDVLRDFKRKTQQEAIFLEIQHNVDFRLI